MSQGTELSVVVPAYNEHDNLKRFDRELLPVLDRLAPDAWRLVIVDDGSRDGTRAIAEALAGRCRDAEVLVHDDNRGLGAALRSGLGAARGACILTLDADLTFAPAQAERLLERYRHGDVDLVIGSPWLAGYDDVPAWRIALSFCANLLYRLALWRKITAVTPIFRLYRSAALSGIEIETDGFDVNAELLTKMLLRGARVAEVPAVLGTRLHGVSKLDNRREAVNHLRLLVKILRWRLA